ncbi:MAG: hypothetical protein ACI4MC_04300, partial [Candidatus Coproplasma sp.]
MKRNSLNTLVVCLFCCLLFVPVLFTGCTNDVDKSYELTAYIGAEDPVLAENRTVYLQPKTSSNDEFVAEVYGTVTDGVNVLHIEKKDYTFSQLAGRVWTARVSVTETNDGDVILYARRQKIGKTVGLEYRTDIYGNELTCEICEGYGEVDWLQCFS